MYVFTIKFQFTHVHVGHFRYPPSAASSSLSRRTESPAATPLSPRTALAEAQEFIDVAEEIDLSVDPGGRTALHLAIVHKHTKVIDTLLQHKGEYGLHMYMYMYVQL